MKALLILSLLITIISQNQGIQTIKAEANTQSTYYAKITTDGNFFYEEPSTSEENKLFVIPCSYFVLLIANANEDFYYAKYLDLYGYVKKDEVTPMDGVPKTPYANSTFRVFSQNGLSLQSQPNTESQTIGKIGFLENDVIYYGEKTGEEPFPESTNIWYYCKPTQNETQKLGYVFSYYCDKKSKITENTEYFPKITGELTFDNELNIKNGGLTDTVKAIIILAVSLPCLIILYLILTPHKKKIKDKNGKLKTIKRGKDYYEFNEDDL